MHCMWDIYAHTSNRCAHQIWGIHAKFGGHICIWNIFGNNLWSKSCSWLCFGIYIQNYLIYNVHVACWPSELYLECGGHIGPVISVKYVLVLLFEWLVPVTSYVDHVYTYNPNMGLICIWQIWYICPLCCHIFFWHIFGDNMWSRGCSWLHFGIDMQKMLGLYAHVVCHCVSYICNLVDMFVQWYIRSMNTVLTVEWLVQVTSYVTYMCAYISISVQAFVIYGSCINVITL